MTRHTILSILILLLLESRINATEAVGYSGMVRISANSYLTVNDRKNGIHKGHRIGVLTITPRDGTVYHPLHVSNWLHKDKEPNDLESCCGIPDKPSEFLLVESGKYNNKYGRIFRVRVDRDKEGAWQAKCLGAGEIKIPGRGLDDKGTTYSCDEIEGAACFKAGGKTILVLGERGGANKLGHKVGRLVWGELNLDKLCLTKIAEMSIVTNSVLGARDCSEIYLQANGKGWNVWSVATHDPDTKDVEAGPYRSVIYCAGKFVLNNGSIRFVREDKPKGVYHLLGLKVEALALPPTCVPKAAFSVGTDDESLGGVWRTLPDNP